MKHTILFLIILSCFVHVIFTSPFMCISGYLFIPQLGISVHMPPIMAPNFQKTDELCSDQIRPIAYVQCVPPGSWTTNNINITENCYYTLNPNVLTYVKNTIMNGTNETTITMMQSIPYADFLLIDISNFISLFQNIVQTVNTDALTLRLSSNKIEEIKYNVFYAISVLMNQTSFLLLKNSSLSVANNLLMTIDYVSENMIVATGTDNEFYDYDAFSVFIFPVLKEKPLSYQTFGIYMTPSTASTQVQATPCKAGNCLNSLTNKIDLSINPQIVNYMSFNLSSSVTPHINYIVFKNSDYFQYTPNSTLTVFGTQFSTTISNYSEIAKQANNTDFIYANIYANKSNSFWYRSSVLAYFEYNDTINIWSTTGCRNTSLASFACNHLTPFSVLMSIQQVFPIIETTSVANTNATNSTVNSSIHSTANTNDLVLSILTYIALILSLVGLFITMLTFLCFKRLRKHFSQKCIFNLSLALSLVYIFFIINSALVETGMIRTTDSSCVILAFCLHYCLLASFLWMLVMAYIQYVMFIKVFSLNVSNFTLKAALISWMIPLIPIIISISLNYTPNVVDQMPNKFIYGLIGSNICWIQGLPFYLTVVLPIGSIILLNIVIFFRVTVGLLYSAKATNELQEDKFKNNSNTQANKIMGRTRAVNEESTNKAKSKKLIAVIFSCFVVLGITWFFGFFGINEAKVVFSYLFCVFNASQGFLVLIAYVLMSKPKREMWANKFKQLKTKLSHNAKNESLVVKNGSNSLKNQVVATNNAVNKGENKNTTINSSSSSSRSTSESNSGINEFKKINENFISYSPSHLTKTDSSNSNQSSNESTQNASIELIRSGDSILGKKKSILTLLRPSSSKPNSPLPDDLKNRNMLIKKNQNVGIDMHKPIISRYTNPELLDSFSPVHTPKRRSLEFEKAIESPIGSEYSYYVHNDDKRVNRIDSSVSNSESVVISRVVNPTGVYVKVQPTAMPKINL